ncbi:MAG TPA: efflux RND transporter periplasmic adaptor subunit [Sphingobium sp.]|uniref:efflux RND transporter periplasmic adaptor subunit n=1 Tax=Sphingobium sp. TaxID=1912891 RepID=UPI002ED141B9
MHHARLTLSTALLCLSVAALSACSGKSGDAKKKPTPQVGFVVVQPSAVPVQTSLPGRIVAYETSEVRPQISGVIHKRFFTEGGTVRAGQPLFQIDPSLYQASVNQANANLASARANAEAAAAKADRYKPLAKIEAVAQQDYTDALALARQARASVAQNSAALDTARINMRFTTVPAPISGKIGRSLFTVGALVSASQADPLAVIQRLDPIYVDMQQSSSELLALRRALSTGGAQKGSTAVRLQLEDGSTYPLVGTVQFSEVTVNASTGTVTLRASFPNPDGVLLPGMFVQARFEQSIDPHAFLVPQGAVQRDLGGEAFILLIGPDNKVVRRNVAADRTYGTSWVVTDGLKPGDKVITQGINGLRPDAEVRPVPANTPERLVPHKAGESGGSGGNSGSRKQGG